MNSKHILLSIAALVLLVIGYFWFINHFEEVEKIRWRGLQGKAKTDEFYIAERFLREKGLDVTRTKTLNPVKETIEPYQTIFMGKTKYALTPTETTALLNWTREGNTLILQGQESDSNFVADKLSQSKSLLDQAGITVTDCSDDACQCQQNDTDDEVEKVATDKDNKTPKTRKNNETIDDKLDKLLSNDDDEDTETLIANGQLITLGELYHYYQYKVTGDSQKTFSQKGNCGKELYAVFKYGKGHLVIYSNNYDIFSTGTYWSELFDENHATYLYWLLHQGGEPKRILWYESQAFPSALTIIWQYWGFTVVMALILILAWIWRHSPRFGSLRVENKMKSLSIARHLHATGQFYYNSEAKNTLLESCYEQVEMEITKHIPMKNRLTQEQLIEKIATLTNVSVKKIAPIVYRQQPNSEAEFIAITQTINQIRKKL